ncbi:galacturonokinase [Canna indica]|uniref:Galacturonokinase n=1 Tax=Canna indica TaxID=4628 RepID=A0AAQ3JQA8_9LILI|nr:galacturonokinase [Canna indica]
MRASSWPSLKELDAVRRKVVDISGADYRDVRVVVSPYRICPLGAHIDHQGGTVTAMTINMGILLGFVPSDDAEVLLQSGQFHGEVKFRVDDAQCPKEVCDEPDWARYPRGAVYALQSKGYHLTKGIIGFICGSDEHSSGLSSSAAVGVAYLLALERANCKTMLPEDNIELDRIIENEYLHLKNGILDQSAILLSKYGFLTWMDCKTRKHDSVYFSELQNRQWSQGQAAFKILLAFSGLKEPLMRNSGYNARVSECKEAAETLLDAAGNGNLEPLLCNVDPIFFEEHKDMLKPNLAKRAFHYFSENNRVKEGLKAWASGNLDDFGRLISASGRSSIENYECGCKEMIDLYEILLKAPGVLGARFSGAGFRGCCLALVDADVAEEAAAFVQQEYKKVQPVLASKLSQDRLVLICEPGDSAHVA